MNVSSSETNEHVVLIDFVVDGPRTASAVARGETKLRAVRLSADNSGVQEFANCAEVLASLPDRRLVYVDALFGRMVERMVGLPWRATFDDLRIMQRLLGENSLEQCPAHPMFPKWHPSGPLYKSAKEHRLSADSMNDVWALKGRIRTRGLEAVYASLEIPMIDPTVTMIANGLAIDWPSLESLNYAASADLEIRRQQICDEAGCVLNPDSPDEVRHLLYDRLKLPVTKPTPRGLRSIDANALARLTDLHPVIAPLRAYSHTRTIMQHAESLNNYRNGRTGRVHGNLDPLGTETGRFSCSEPNLLALVADVTNCVAAPEGYSLIELDFSQMELGVLAHLSQDQALLAAFRSGVDLHRQTAAEVLGFDDVSQITQYQRDKIGKPLNFAIIYGETAHGLSDTLSVPLEAAQQCIDRYFSCHPQVSAWRQQIIAEAHRLGFVWTSFGRQRRLQGLTSRDPCEVKRAERQAVNTVVQGTAADIFKLAIIRLYKMLPLNCRLLLPIHDAVIIEVPEREALGISRFLKGVFEEVPLGFTVRIPVKASIGKTWAEQVDIGSF